MSLPLGRMRLHEPRTLRAALRLLRDEGPLVPLAGCTDVYVALHLGAPAAPGYLDLSRLDALRGVWREGPDLAIGALTTHAELQRSALVRRRLPMLAAAAAEVGGPQIQNRGTLGGNVANGSPAGDTLPVLAAADARVRLQNAAGRRELPFVEFYSGYRRSLRRDDELIVALVVPPVTGRQWFRKLGTRAAQAISKVVAAGTRGGGRVAFALGSVAPTVVRARRAEAALAAGQGPAAACAALQADIAPIDDLRSSAAYRRHVAARLLERFWIETA